MLPSPCWQNKKKKKKMQAQALLYRVPADLKIRVNATTQLICQGNPFPVSLQCMSNEYEILNKITALTT